VCPHHPYLLHLLYRAGSSGDVVAATSFTAAALIGAAPALEAQAIASPAARLRKKNVLRMNVLPEGSPVGNDNASDVAVRRMFTFQVWQAARAQGQGQAGPSDLTDWNFPNFHAFKARVASGPAQRDRYQYSTRNENHVSGQARASFALETEIHAPRRNEHDLFVVVRMARRVRARLDARPHCHTFFTRDNTLGHRTLIVKNGLNSFSFTSGRMPVPLSRILLSPRLLVVAVTIGS